MSEPVAKHRPMIDLEEFERRLRRPVPPADRGDDPLAELARLVAGDADPYQDVFEPPAHEMPAPEPAWQDMPEPAAAQSHRMPIDFAAIEAGLLRGSVEPQGHGEPVLPPEPAMAGFHEARYPAAAPEWQAVAPDAPRRSRAPLYMVAGVIVLGIAGIGASFAYKGHLAGPQQLATIMAASGPTKVQPPQQSDGDTTAQQASVLDKSAAQTAVALSDHREEPVDVSQIKTQPPAANPAAAPDSSYLPPPPGQVPLRDPTSVALPAAAMPNATDFQQPVGIAALIEPKKVKTVSVRPDGTVLATDTAAPAAPPPVPPSTRPAVAKPSTPKTTTRVVTPPKPAAPERTAANAPLTPAKPKPVAARPVRVAEATPEASEAQPAAASAGAGTFAVQVAAPGTEKEAREASSRFERQFGSDLDGHQAAVHKAKVGDKDVYRVRVGGLSRDQAVSMCEKIKSGGGKCFIARN